ncbi:encapsidation protein IVa2 [Simian adenovirus DM-2014]|uniref:Packaging protein 1 n=1 Tax=Simian adenovirus DM-2014 TaxID=1560346 RepID=A0A097IWB6_9ADEN|nr:encapsidation protein IVa2 [Simian adenovirus DM-2014]AIT70972.1 encapsidation protein IVa2 [Simian adenovirus DM-2014]
MVRVSLRRGSRNPTLQRPRGRISPLRTHGTMLSYRLPGRKRTLLHQSPEFQTHPSKRSTGSPSFHRYGNNLNSNAAPLERHDSNPAGCSSPRSLQQQPAQSPQSGSELDRSTLDHITELWERLQILTQTLQSMPLAEGLKPLKNFTSLQELLSLGGQRLLQELVKENKHVHAMMNEVAPFLREDGSCTSLNYHLQPVIGVIYGPTGSGKSQLLRNLLSTQLITPAPETVFFIAPQVDMIPPGEIKAWEMQICEGNFVPGPEGTLVPQSGTLRPRFHKMSYEELTHDYNYDVTDSRNVFAQAAAQGPIAIIMDECMENLGGHKGISKFFHAFPSKLHDKFPKCTGYTVLVVLHNMNPRRDLGGNISNLKIQSKLHIMSPRMHPSQLNRFINTYTKGLPVAITLLLKDIFQHHAQRNSYDWIIYNTTPEHEALQWSYLHPKDGLMPMYLNIQTHLYRVMEKIHKVLNDRERWSRAYHKKNKQ